jgi:antitoxin VapB
VITLAYAHVYAGDVSEVAMKQPAKIFMNNRSQAVRLPKEFQFHTSEVFIHKQGDEVMLSARPTDGSEYLASGPVASPEFMDNVEELPMQEREF